MRNPIFRLAIASSIFAICACDNSTTTPNNATSIPRNSSSIGISAGHLVDANGFALYTTTAGCTGDCLTVWPRATANQAPIAIDGVTQSSIGLSGNQVTYNGALLYYFQSDSLPGQATGNNQEGFTLVNATGTTATTTRNSSSIGVSNGHLVDANGFALYDTPATCTGTCLTAWPAVMATTVPTATGTATQSSIGLSAGQVTYGGQMLYYFHTDSMPGQITGSGVNGFSLVTP